MRKWIRISGAGEFRGEGRWIAVAGEAMERDFENCKRTGLFPVAWSVEGVEKVTDARQVAPNIVLDDGMLLHQFHEIAVPVIGNGEASIRYAAKQLASVIESLTQEGAAC